LSRFRPTAKFLRVVALVLGAAVVVFLDQLAKGLVIANLQPRVSYDFLGSVVRLYLTYNNSAAFSMGFGVTWIFTIISSLAALALLWFGLRVRTLGWAALTALALGGVTGNLIDRLTRAPGFPSGQVVDFIQIPFNFPIFNLADSAICIAAAVVVIAVGRGKKLGG
jgi:signal peptidase II